MKILVAEDEPEIMRIYKILLGEKGYQVFPTEDGKKCVEIYRSELKKTMDSEAPFDLVILDYRMPEKNGVEVADEILDLHPAQKLLMVTAYRDQLGLKDQKFKVMQVMEKPFDINELLSTVEKLAIH